MIGLISQNIENSKLIFLSLMTLAAWQSPLGKSKRFFYSSDFRIIKNYFLPYKNPLLIIHLLGLHCFISRHV
jgi:hypothetical protein